eukprot:TRINITY_DN10968_c0_g1_i1.p2 TRINITY_DN10968_c0_g1~~TRINITY_DN10968_c0_g1_i1.p2  ORF type:complete len:101 (+),score=10.27 TRINITY_DN10968_c0_g1_i1:131-433(+)
MVQPKFGMLKLFKYSQLSHHNSQRCLVAVGPLGMETELFQVAGMVKYLFGTVNHIEYSPHLLPTLMRSTAVIGHLMGIILPQALLTERLMFGRVIHFLFY